MPEFQQEGDEFWARVRVRYQAFPCIRVVRPGEFSIGPHCDVMSRLPSPPSSSC